MLDCIRMNLSMCLYCSQSLSMFFCSLSISASVFFIDSKKFLSMGYSKKLARERISEWKAWYIRYDRLSSLFADEKLFMLCFKNELSRIDDFFAYAEKEIINAKRLVLPEQRGTPVDVLSEPERQKTHSIDSSTSNRPQSDTAHEFDVFSLSSSTEYNTSTTNTEDALGAAQEQDTRVNVENLSFNREESHETVPTDEKCSREHEKDTIIEIDDANSGEVVSESECARIHCHRPDTKTTTKTWTGIVVAHKDRILKNNIFMKNYDKNMSKRALLDYISDLKQMARYRNLNLLGFKKILYRYDRVKGRNITHILMPLVERSYLNVSRDIDTASREASLNYQRKYHRNNPEKAKTILRRISRREKPSQPAIFFAGVVLTLCIVFHVHISEIVKESAAQYYFAVLAVLVATLLFGACVIVFKHNRINYNYIFHFNHASRFENSSLLLSCSVLILAHQLCTFYLYKKYGPLIVVVTIVAIAHPFNVFYRSSRYTLLGSLLKVFSAPFFSVKFKHFFLADVLQSFVLCIRLFLLSCGVKPGSWLYLAMAWPALLRTLQCARRYFDEALTVHVYNGMKYMLSMASTIVGTYPWQHKHYAAIAQALCAGSTVYSLYWDLFIDWNIFRSKYLFPLVAYAAITAINVFLRFIWLFRRYVPMTDSTCVLVEVGRRFLWLLIRVEHEHLNNCNQLKAMKYVKLPFQETFYRKNYEPLETEDTRDSEPHSVEV